MNIDLIYSTLIKVFDSHELDMIVPAISNVIDTIEAMTEFPQDSGLKDTYLEARKYLVETLTPAKLHCITAFDVDILRHVDVENILPSLILKRVSEIDITTSFSFDMASIEFTKISDEFETAYDNALIFHETLEKLGAVDIFRYNEAYLAFIMSSPSYDGSFMEYVEAQKHFENSLRFILNGSDIENKSTDLVALSNSTPTLIIGATAGAILVLCKVLQSILKTIHEKKKIDLLSAQIKTEQVKSEKLEAELKNFKIEIENKEVENLAKSLVGDGDGEKLSLLEKGIRKLFDCLEKGHSVEIVLGGYHEDHDSGIKRNKLGDGEGLTLNQFKEISEASRDIEKLSRKETPDLISKAKTKKIEQAD